MCTAEQVTTTPGGRLPSLAQRPYVNSGSSMAAVYHHIKIGSFSLGNSLFVARRAQDQQYGVLKQM